MNETPDKKLYEALFNLKSKMKAVIKDAINPHFRSNYADLNSHLDEVEPLCVEFGLILTQSTYCHHMDGLGVCNMVKTSLTHKDSGGTVSSALALPQLADMQKLGSAITYARRYTLSALLGMRAEDDDGNGAIVQAGKPSNKKAPLKKSAISSGDTDF